jgi:flagellar motor switch/type III secretory pathway protein FliN
MPALGAGNRHSSFVQYFHEDASASRYPITRKERNRYARGLRQMSRPMGLTQSSIEESFYGGAPPSGDPQPAPPREAAPARPSAGETRPRPLPEPDVSRILGMEVPLSAILAERDMAVQAILEITVGTIIEFDKPFEQELDLHVAGRCIAYGHAVKVGENFGLRISRIGPVKDRIDAMGPQR